MSSMEPTLHLICGKIAAGKSTLARSLGRIPNTIVVKEDYWLARLYPGEQNSLADYIRNSTRLREAMTAHLIELLRSGMSVVLDFPANTLASRAWMRSLFEEAGCAHRLHYLEVADEVCKARLRRRNEAGEHEFKASDEDFDLFTSYFIPPSADEAISLNRQRTGASPACFHRSAVFGPRLRQAGEILHCKAGVTPRSWSAAACIPAD